MLQNRTTITRATAFAVAIAAAASPCVAAPIYAANTNTIVLDIEDFHAFEASSAWASLREKLDRWSMYPADWDGADGVAPNDATVNAAEVLLNELESVEAPLPTASLSGDGEVVFEWVKGDGYASVSLTDDGHMIAFLREPGFDQPVRIDQQFDAAGLSPFLNRIGAFV